jgi:hypothetical protein
MKRKPFKEKRAILEEFLKTNVESRLEGRKIELIEKEKMN